MSLRTEMTLAAPPAPSRALWKPSSLPKLSQLLPGSRFQAVGAELLFYEVSSTHRLAIPRVRSPFCA